METLVELQNILDANQSNQDLELEVATRMKIGYLHKQQRKWPLALRAYQESLQIAIDQKDAAKTACIQACMGTVLWEQAQLNKAIACFEQSLSLLAGNPDADAERAVKAILSISLWRRGEWDRALQLLIETRPLIKTEVPQSYQPLYEAIEKAIEQIENRIPAAQGNNNIRRVMQAHFTLVSLNLLLDRQEPTKIHLNISNSLAMQLNDEKILQTIPELQSLLS
jgi:tetratricopeptide (TPR) repeat protein